jgi:hypothetical protein
MSDARRRLILRAGFLACCALPTLIVAQWVLFPRRTAEWETIVRHAIGCPIEIESIETPAPNEVVFHRMRLSLPGMAQPLELTKVHWRQGIDRLDCELAAVESTSEQFAVLVQILAHQLATAPQDHCPLDIRCARLTLRDGSGDDSDRRSFVANACRLRLDSAARQAAVRLELSSQEAPQTPIRIEWQSDAAAQSGRWAVDTGPVVLPNWLLQPIVPSARLLGETSWLAGRLEGRWEGRSTTIEANNVHLLNLDVATMLQAATRSTAPWNSPLTSAPGARFDATIGSGRWVDGRLESMFTEFRCLGGGQIDAAWLRAARRWLQVNTTVDLATASSIPFSQLLVGFEIRGGELYVWGRRSDGLIASGADNQPLITASEASQRLSPQALAGWLSGDERADLPVSTAALEILSHMSTLR